MDIEKLNRKPQFDLKGEDLNIFNPITEPVISCANTVSNVLGSGFLEKIYENALARISVFIRGYNSRRMIKGLKYEPNK
jgi:hypothetical protein